MNGAHNPRRNLPICQSLPERGKRNGVGAPKKHRWTAIFSCQQTIPIIIEFQFAAKHLPRLDIVEV